MRTGLMLIALTLAACTGDFDQREDVADTTRPGGRSVGTVANPNQVAFVRGTASIGGAVRNAIVVLRPVDGNGGIDWREESVLGQGITFENGIYQVGVIRETYRGPIVVEVRGQHSQGVVSEGGNPATANTNRLHRMSQQHVLYGLLPWFDGYSTGETHVTPLTSFAVGRAQSFDGSIAGVQGALSAGLFGLCCRQTATFFGIPRVRASQPADFAGTGGFGTDRVQSYALAALGQLARDIGVANVWDFWLGLYLDGLDDGEANGSIGFVPNTGIAMPDLGQAGLIGTTLRDRFLAPGNPDRVVPPDNVDIGAGTPLDVLIQTLDTVRDINAASLDYDFVFRVPPSIDLVAGGSFRTSVIAARSIPGGNEFHPLGDSAGESFVEFEWTSSAPADISVQPWGVVTASPTAPLGDYSLELTVRPRVGQTFLTGPVRTFMIPVRIR